MKKILITFSLFITGLLNAEISFQEKERLALIADQIHHQQWNTLDWQSAPLIITFESGDIFAFNLRSKDPHFEPLSVGNETVLFAKEDVWGVSGLHMQSHFEIEGQDAFLYQMGLSDSAKEDVSVLVHERFHRHQGEKFQMKGKPGNSVDHLSEENLTWVEIEDVLLREFLAGSGNDKLESLKDFIAVNQMRREAIDPETKDWENGQLRMEGLADYVGTKELGGERLLLEMHPEQDHENDFIDEAIKWRHYMAGAALGYALDLIGVQGWQAKIEAGEILPDLLNKAMPLSRSDQEKRIKKVQARLNYKKRRQLAGKRVDNYQRRVNSLESNYEKQEGIKLFLAHPPMPISGGGANDEMVYIEEGIVALNDSSVATTNDGQWKFETKNISHLFQLSGGIREVKVHSDVKVVLDQVSLDLPEALKEPKEFLFENLVIQCDSSVLQSAKHPGILVVDHEGLHVKYL